VIVDNRRARDAGWTPSTSLAQGLVGVWDEWSRSDTAGAVGDWQ
jgi:hypothetical protein